MFFLQQTSRNLIKINANEGRREMKEREQDEGSDDFRTDEAQGHAVTYTNSRSAGETEMRKF